MGILTVIELVLTLVGVIIQLLNPLIAKFPGQYDATLKQVMDLQTSATQIKKQIQINYDILDEK